MKAPAKQFSFALLSIMRSTINNNFAHTTRCLLLLCVLLAWRKIIQINISCNRSETIFSNNGEIVISLNPPRAPTPSFFNYNSSALPSTLIVACWRFSRLGKHLHTLQLNSINIQHKPIFTLLRLAMQRFKRGKNIFTHRSGKVLFMQDAELHAQSIFTSRFFVQMRWQFQ